MPLAPVIKPHDMFCLGKEQPSLNEYPGDMAENRKKRDKVIEADQQQEKRYGAG